MASSTMAMDAGHAAWRTSSQPSAQEEQAVHVRTYRKFVVFARCAACAVPLLVAFLLYWTT